MAMPTRYTVTFWRRGRTDGRSVRLSALFCGLHEIQALREKVVTESHASHEVHIAGIDPQHPDLCNLHEKRDCRLFHWVERSDRLISGDERSFHFIPKTPKVGDREKLANLKRPPTVSTLVEIKKCDVASTCEMCVPRMDITDTNAVGRGM